MSRFDEALAAALKLLWIPNDHRNSVIWFYQDFMVLAQDDLLLGQSKRGLT
jgi:hypothetical protein